MLLIVFRVNLPSSIELLAEPVFPIAQSCPTSFTDTLSIEPIAELSAKILNLSVSAALRYSEYVPTEFLARPDVLPNFIL